MGLRTSRNPMMPSLNIIQGERGAVYSIVALGFWPPPNSVFQENRAYSIVFHGYLPTPSAVGPTRSQHRRLGGMPQAGPPWRGHYDGFQAACGPRARFFASRRRPHRPPSPQVPPPPPPTSSGLPPARILCGSNGSRGATVALLRHPWGTRRPEGGGRARPGGRKLARGPWQSRVFVPQGLQRSESQIPT